METPPKVWGVFVVYGLAAVAIVLASMLAIAVLHAADPDLAPEDVLRGVHGLIAGALASSAALLGTCWIATRGLTLGTASRRGPRARSGSCRHDSRRARAGAGARLADRADRP